MGRPGMLALSSYYHLHGFFRLDFANSGIYTSNTVCWWNTFDAQYPGACWGFATANSTTGQFQFEANVICDSAAWINEAYLDVL